MESLLLVHSPLLGPSSWKPLAELAASRGYGVAVPDLTGIADLAQGWGAALTRSAADGAADLRGEVFVVGHSGAGPYLPRIADQITVSVGALVFVDASLPPISGSYTVSDDQKRLLDANTENGLLLPWLDWWPDTLIDQMLPDPAARRTLCEDIPRLPRSFYSAAVAAPSDWTSRPCGYVQLSRAYGAEYQTAIERGWRHTRLDGSHLSLVTEPEVVLDLIESVVA